MNGDTVMSASLLRGSAPSWRSICPLVRYDAVNGNVLLSMGTDTDRVKSGKESVIHAFWSTDGPAHVMCPYGSPMPWDGAVVRKGVKNLLLDLYICRRPLSVARIRHSTGAGDQMAPY